MNSRKNIFWGLLLMAAAGLVLFKDRLPGLNMPIWSVLLVIFFSFEALQHLLKRDIRSAFVGLAIVTITLNSYYQWLEIGFWSMVLAAGLMYAGLRLLFPKKNIVQSYVTHEGRAEKLYGKNLGESVRYIHDDQFEEGYADFLFSSSSIYFDNAQMLGNKANFYLDVVFGSVTLYIPSNWAVDLQMDNVFSSVDCPHSPLNADKVLTLYGDAVFSAVTIVSR